MHIRTSGAKTAITALSTATLVSALAFAGVGTAVAQQQESQPRQQQQQTDEGGSGSGSVLDLSANLNSIEVAGNGLKTVATYGTFAEPGWGATAVTYDPELVPVGAKAGVTSVTRAEAGTVTELMVRGLVPNREYGAHVHTDSCGPQGADAGPHYQHVQDPNPPSTDPRYANPENEIWLDFTTGEDGTATATSRVDWTYGERRPASVVIHERHTSTAPGEAGEAGARLACIDVPF